MYSSCLLDRLGAKYDGKLEKGAQPCHFAPSESHCATRQLLGSFTADPFRRGFGAISNW